MVQPPEEAVRAAELLERLLTDSEFRARFRRNPSAACEEFGLPELAREFGAGAKSLYTLEIRESRSSLAGAFMAAASESSEAIDALRRLHEQSEFDGLAHHAVQQALTSPRLQTVGHDSLPGRGAGSLSREYLGSTGHGSQTLAGMTASPEVASALGPPGVAELVENPHLALSPEAHAELLAGGVDHRLVSVLTELTKGHELGIGALHSGGGAGGDTLDILSVNGQRISASNIAARDLVDELSSLDPSLRPAQIVAPWPVAAQGFSTGSGHDDRIQLVFGAPASASAPTPGLGAAVEAQTPASAPDPAPSPAVESQTPPSVQASPVSGVAASLPGAVGHQSLVVGSVARPSQGHNSMQLAVAGDHAGGAPSPEQASSGFDPAVAGVLPDASTGYPGDGASQQAIAAWMGRQAHLMGLPAELPVMAALTESGLKNDNYGDRDSLGYFQMRASIWDNGQYAGFPDHPELQLKWFLSEALAVRQQAISEGDPSFGSDPKDWGNWVADVERPLAAYRGRYQLHLEQAQSLLTQGNPGGSGQAVAGSGGEVAAGGSGEAVEGGAGQAATVAVEPGGEAAFAQAPTAVDALAIAERYLGTPYHWGGNTPATGFDCSGLVQYAYSQVGIHLPRVAADQFDVGTPVTRAELQPGDIVFFQDPNGYIHHEGIYIGNNEFLEAPHTGADVRISSLNEPYYAQQFAGGRNVSDLAAGGASAPPAPNQSRVIAAVGSEPVPRSPGNTVQILPAVTDPALDA